MARGLSKGSQPESPRGYLFGIARRVSQAAWRRSYREREAVSLDIPTETLAAPKVDDRIAAAHELIAAMPDLQREILDLRFSQQLSYAEIAEALDIPLGTVRSRLHHALIAVRERLAEDEHES
jgi:RNA polymerase sigma-70 factor (ECF subfamily)